MTEEVTEKTIGSDNKTYAAPKSRSGLWIGIIVVLLIALIAGAGFVIYQQLRSQGDDISKEDQRNERLEKQISDFQSQLTTMQSQLTEASSTLSNADERFEKKMSERTKTQEEKLETTRKELTGAVLQIQRQLGKTRGDWLIADAEYLLSVAGQRLHLIGDVDTTREALEAADQRLRESGDAAVFKVRDEIAKELASLKAIPEIDLVGMYAKLQSLSGRVNQLTLFLPYDGKPMAKSSEHDKHPAPSQTSSDLLNTALKQFDGYVTVRHTAQPIKAILTKEEAEFIRQQLSLKLEMVKLALVQKNQLLYQTSLEDALTWIDKNFNKNAQTQQFVAELNQLNANKLNAQMPDISLSLKMLRDISKLRIESDKAAPAIDLQSKLEHPKAEEAKPVAPETPAVVAPEVAKPEAKTESKATVKPEVKPDTATTPTAKPEVKIDPKAAPVKPEAKPDAAKTETTPAAAKPEVKTDPKATVKPEVKMDAKPEVKTEKAADVKKITPATSEPKKAIENTPAPTDTKETSKADSAAKTAEKKSQPVVINPVAPH